MRQFIKIASISFLCATMVLGSAAPAFAANSKTPVGNQIQFDVSQVNEQDRIQSLAQPDKEKLCFYDNGTSPFTIVYPDDCTDTLLYAVKTLQESLAQMTGTQINALPASKASQKQLSKTLELSLGTALKPTSSAAGVDGYRLRITDSKIQIDGTNDAGTCNGVYGFLEDFLGCLFLSPNETYVPKQPTIYLLKTDKVYKPSLDWRNIYSYETAENRWSAKLRLNGIDTTEKNQSLPMEQRQYDGWGTWCHDCYGFLSPDEYFDSHPEYFSYSKKEKKRVHTYGDRDAFLCLSNPEVFEIVKASMAQKMKENPDALYWDFSGSDNSSIAGCECDECSKLDEAAGGTGMGTLLPFLNKLAKAFPDKYISTLAYQHTLKAPSNMKAEPNVVIKLCSMPGDQASSYLDGNTPGALEFKKQVEQWSSIAEHIVIWDYVVNFQNLLLPFPNFAVQAENQKFYEEHHVDGVFHQASREIGGEFSCLRSYLLSRLMWEGSKLDVAATVSRYLSVAYGDAAPFIAQYMNQSANELYTSAKPLGLYDALTPHYNGYLSEKNVRSYAALFEKAEQAVQGNELLLNRVKQAKIPVLYATTLLPDIPANERDLALQELTTLCGQFKITEVCEWDSLKNYQKTGMKKAVADTRKAVHKGRYIAIYAACGVAAAAGLAGIGFLVYRRIRKSKA